MSGTVPEYRRTLWWYTAGVRPPMETLTSDTTVDVAIVGGGFTGLTAALHLAPRGVRVAVLEAEEIGAGASGLNAGFVVPNLAKADPELVLARLGEERGRRLLDLVGRGGDRVFEIVRDCAIDCDAVQTGWLQPAHSESACAIAQARVAFWQSLGRPVDYLSATEIAARTGMNVYRAALLDRSGGTIHPLNYAYGLARAVRERGAAVYEHAAVLAAERQGGAWRLRCGDTQVTADRVVIATNATGSGIARRLGRTVIPLHVYQIATSPMRTEIVHRIAPERQPVSDMRSNLFTYRLDRNDRLISGGMAIIPVGAHGRVARTIVARLAAELRLRAVPDIAHVWRGTAAMTTDFLPHLLEFAPGMVGGIGCNGRGIATTAMLGEVLADAVCGTKLTELPVPVLSSRPLPWHRIAGILASAGLAHARWQDWRSRAT
jgi:glycine/D-amino acid oxidase-like deaminating enzyme